jgi:hypothetical protein
MALFTDGTISNSEDLTGHDSGVLEVASTEGIDVTKKLRLAQDELAVELTALLSDPDTLRNLVVTTPLRLWHAFQTLTLVYRDAYYNQLNERYGGKRDEYAALARWAANKLMDAGIGLVSNPMAKAEAPELDSVPGAQTGGTYYACVSWLNGDGEEGAAGEWRSLTVGDGGVLAVRPANPPANAMGWNVFVGLSPDALAQQNESVLTIGQRWLQNATVATVGKPPGTGQIANYVRSVPRVLQRG